jgi:hypothetical protein
MRKDYGAELAPESPLDKLSLKIRTREDFLPGLTELSERDSSGLEYIDPTALWRISCYNHGLCQWLGGDLVNTATA